MNLRALLCASSLLVGVHVFAAAPASTQPDDRNWRSKPNYQTIYTDYLDAMRGKRVDIVFIGDSITEQFRWGVGKNVWDKHYASRALNFGQSGDRTQNVLWRLQNLPVHAFRPRVGVVLIGTNNHEDSPEDIVAGVRAVIAQTKTRFPGIKIVLLSILPNARATEKMAAVNQLLPALEQSDGVRYLDLAANFTPVADNWKGLSRDKLHLSPEGYALWAEALDPVLAEILK